MYFVLIPSPLMKLIEDVLNSLFFNEHLLIYRVWVRYQYFYTNKADCNEIKYLLYQTKKKDLALMEILYRFFLKT